MMELNKNNLIIILKENIQGFNEELSLREQMDSILVVSLVLIIEEVFQIQCDLRVFSDENLHSVEALLVYLKSL